MGKSSGPPANYSSERALVGNAADQQLQNNRLNTYSPFAMQTFGSDGTTQTQFRGGLGDAYQGLLGQAGQMAKPVDWGQFGPVRTGDQARDQAVNAAYGQAASRLDPQWDRRMDQSRTQLLNQGLDPNSQAYKGAMSELGQQRNDAYGSAMNSAIGQGTAAGDSAFRNNLMAQQQSIANALRQRELPMSELQQMQGFLAQPQYNGDNSSLAGGMMQANLGKAEHELNYEQGQYTDKMNQGGALGILGGAGAIAAAAMF